MNPWITRVRSLVFEAPHQAKLAYCLLRDDRVPNPPKVALLGALGVIIGPLDLPAWIPVVGELDVLALSILAVKVFVEACPEALVADHERLLRERRSRFDQDLRALLQPVYDRAGRALERWWPGLGNVVSLRGRLLEPADSGATHRAAAGGDRS